MRAAAGLLAACALAVSARAEAPLVFRFERPVTPAGKGGNRLSVDTALLSGGAPLRYRRVLRTGAEPEEPPVFEGGLEDLRFFDASGLEVGYLLIAPRRESPSWRAGQILPVAATKTQSGFEVDLGGIYRVDRLAIQGIPAPYLKRVSLEAGGDRTRWTQLVAEGTVFKLPEEKLERDELEFPAGEYRYFRVLWDDRTSGRVPQPRGASARLADLPAPPPATRVAVVFERRPSEPGKSRFRIRLPGPRLPVTALELSIASGHVLRRAEVSEPRLSGGEVTPASLGSATLRRAEQGGVVAADLSVPIAFPDGPDLDLVVDDGNNPSLQLSGVEARLAPLPWIYFESADGGGLTARFGAAAAASPRYDLEAVRESASKSAPAEARWGDRRPMPEAPAAAVSPVPMGGAPIDASKFRHVRAVPQAAAGLNALKLDAAVEADSTLADVRLVDGEGRQVPYLLEKQDEPLTVELAAPEPLPRDPAAPARSRYRLRLPYATLPALRLVVGTPARVFERHVTVWAERPSEQGLPGGTAELASADWRHAEPESPAPPLVLSLSPPGSAELTLSIDEGDNTPLPLTKPTVLLPSYRIRFFGSQGQSLQILYGQSELAAPRYDLALLATRLVGAAAHELTLPPDRAPTPAAPASPIQTRVFWGILILAVAAFLVIIVRLMKKETPRP